ncbi:hypothetical protein CSKR_100197, partial [Clonorchis sinensis]
QWLRCELTDQKVPNVRIQSRLGQPGCISAAVLPSGGMAATNQKDVTAKPEARWLSGQSASVLIGRSVAWATWMYLSRRASFGWHGSYEPKRCYSQTGGEMAQRSERERTDWKVRGSNPASASRLPLSRLGQPGSILALVLPSGGVAARHRKGATAERFFLQPNDYYLLERLISS